MALEVVLSNCVTGNKKIKTMPVHVSTFLKGIWLFAITIGINWVLPFIHSLNVGYGRL